MGFPFRFTVVLQIACNRDLPKTILTELMILRDPSHVWTSVRLTSQRTVTPTLATTCLSFPAWGRTVSQLHTEWYVHGMYTRPRTCSVLRGRAQMYRCKTSFHLAQLARQCLQHLHLAWSLGICTEPVYTTCSWGISCMYT